MKKLNRLIDKYKISFKPPPASTRFKVKFSFHVTNKYIKKKGKKNESKS
jgi:hypothetical protein